MVSCFQFSRKQTVTSFEFVSRDMFSHFIMFYILNKIKAYDLCNSGGFGYRWVEFRKPNTPISTRLNPKMCDWKPDDPQRPARLTIFRFGLFGLNRFADFYPPLNIYIRDHNLTKTNSAVSREKQSFYRFSYLVET
jgi:hypothetical protein